MSTKLDRPSKKNTKSALLAISGGVDSIVLLNLLGTRPIAEKTKGDVGKLIDLIDDFVADCGLSTLELAYIDHSQRPDTSLDIRAIEQLAKKLSLKLHIAKLELPKNSSEQLARHKRYAALEQIRQQRELDKIITAHHADDVLETALINLTRGTGPKGLSSLRHQEKGIWRPFLYKFKEGIYITKQDLLEYAYEEGLSWHEDSTNKSNRHLRNRFRHRLDGQSTQNREEALRLISKSVGLNQNINAITVDIESALKTSDDGNQTYSIGLFKTLPEEVKNQFLHTKISQNGFDVNKQSVDRAKEFVQSKTTGKILQLKGCEIRVLKGGAFQVRAIPKD